MQHPAIFKTKPSGYRYIWHDVGAIQPENRAGSTLASIKTQSGDYVQTSNARPATPSC